jgi:hypothetical protein
MGFIQETYSPFDGLRVSGWVYLDFLCKAREGPNCSIIISIDSFVFNLSMFSN